jgi:hypothetical protein
MNLLSSSQETIRSSRQTAIRPSTSDISLRTHNISSNGLGKATAVQLFHTIRTNYRPLGGHYYPQSLGPRNFIHGLWNKNEVSQNS